MPRHYRIRKSCKYKDHLNWLVVILHNGGVCLDNKKEATFKCKLINRATKETHKRVLKHSKENFLLYLESTLDE
jgi:hypothetical protein